MTVQGCEVSPGDEVLLHPLPLPQLLGQEFSNTLAVRNRVGFCQKTLGDLFAILGSLYPSNPKML